MAASNNHTPIQNNNNNKTQRATTEQSPNFANNDNSTLLVVATLITTLTYQIGTNIPGGYYQDDNGHVAGDPIMRDKHRRRYWLFMTGAWGGFASSMLVTLALLLGYPAKSWLVRAPFCCGVFELGADFHYFAGEDFVGDELGFVGCCHVVLVVCHQY